MPARRTGVWRQRSSAAGGLGRRQPLRHERSRPDHDQQIRISPADVSPAGSVRGQRLDALARHALEHSRGHGRLHPPLRALLARRGDRQWGLGHGRDARHLASAAGDPGGDCGRCQVAADPRGLQQGSGGKAGKRLGTDVGLSQPDRADQCLRFHRQPPSRRPRRVSRGGQLHRHDDRRLLFGLSTNHASQRRADRPRRLQRACAEKDRRGPGERSLVGQPLPGNVSGTVRHRGSRQGAVVRRS